ncbi:Major facilitator superfamily domain-containing protein 4 [Mizuhopecten yessoensis]|uniref:Major facilitator superfamily domain-containing protein 4 n=1 Tax=Mizuhopecten yessoensis TaxID=6573 RepID=A0A210QIK6_MIZYE|nr:Major facilitator superfamily domain-containing protein 4 [Mizuhopecten yessoensis]
MIESLSREISNSVCVDCVPGGNAEVIKLWTKDSRTLVVGLHLVFNIGGVLSPLIIAPYLMTNVVVRNSSHHVEDQAYAPNCTNGDNNVLRCSAINLSTSNTTFENTTISMLGDGQKFTSKIHIAYIISAVSCLLVAFLFMSLYFSKKWKCFVHSIGVATENDGTGGEVSKKEKSQLKLTRTFKIVALVVMITISTLSKAIDHAFAAYLSAFCVDALHWSTQNSSYLTSAYFVCVVIGGACGTIMTKVTSLIMYEGLQVALMLVSFICLALSVTHSAAAGIWVAASLFGFAKSVIFPLTLAWTNDSFVKISGKISSVFFTSTMAGSVTNPLLLGYIMTKFSKMWFCYFFLIESILLLIFYIIAVLLTKHAKHICRDNDSEQFDIT